MFSKISSLLLEPVRQRKNDKAEYTPTKFLANKAFQHCTYTNNNSMHKRDSYVNYILKIQTFQHGNTAFSG